MYINVEKIYLIVWLLKKLRVRKSDGEKERRRSTTIVLGFILKYILQLIIYLFTLIVSLFKKKTKSSSTPYNVINYTRKLPSFSLTEAEAAAAAPAAVVGKVFFKSGVKTGGLDYICKWQLYSFRN